MQYIYMYASYSVKCMNDWLLNTCWAKENSITTILCNHSHDQSHTTLSLPLQDRSGEAEGFNRPLPDYVKYDYQTDTGKNSTDLLLGMKYKKC